MFFRFLGSAIVDIPDIVLGDLKEHNSGSISDWINIDTLVRLQRRVRPDVSQLAFSMICVVDTDVAWKKTLRKCYMLDFFSQKNAP